MSAAAGTIAGMADAVVGEDGVARCPWAGGPGMMRDYHDQEWGLPVTGDPAVFERLTLEAFQSGLSWATILRKRDRFREVFDGFVPALVAAYDDQKVAALLADPGIVRNRLKIAATLVNARAVLDLQAAGGSLQQLVAEHRPVDPVVPTTTDQVPAVSPESTALSKDLKRRGFTFVGPVTMEALMQALGVVDGHLVGCHRRGCAEPAREGRAAPP